MKPMRKVEHVIVGAGLAGLVMARFLKDRNIALLDPSPFAYKIGESLIPELFRHPELAALLDDVRKLPSYTEKHGTTFVGHEEVACFPLASIESNISMHVFRSELEALFAARWRSPIERARMIGVDLDARVVHTDAGAISFSGQLIDCSGPAMTLASLLGEVRAIRPVHAAWRYHDVVSVDDDGYRSALAATGRRILRLDPRHNRLVLDDELLPWRGSQTTILTNVENGVWCWQIPLYGGRILSFGVVSRHGAIDRARYDDIVERATAACYTIRHRPEGDAPLDRFHSRSGFARQAHRAATDRFILLSDAYAFSDPVYSVGTAFAVNQSVQVANRLLGAAWDEEAAQTFCGRSEYLLERASKAFDLWYDGYVTSSDASAAEVQTMMLRGQLFHAAIAEHYGNVLNDADLEGSGDMFQPVKGAVDVALEMEPLLDGVDAAPWRCVGAHLAHGGVRLCWSHATSGDEIVTLVSPLLSATPVFGRAGALGTSYLDGGPPIAAERREALMTALGRAVAAREADWLGWVGHVQPSET